MFTNELIYEELGHGSSEHFDTARNATSLSVKSDFSYPKNAEQLGQCIMLFDVDPDSRSMLKDLAPMSAQWRLLSENWDALEGLYRRNELKALDDAISLLLKVAA